MENSPLTTILVGDKVLQYRNAKDEACPPDEATGVYVHQKNRMLRASLVPNGGLFFPNGSMAKGDVPNHPFHGNQYTGGIGSGLSTREMLMTTLRNNGLTYQPFTHTSPKPGDKVISVSAFPERSQVFDRDKLTPAALREYVNRNKDLLSDPKNSFGTWLDKESGKVFLDVVVLTKSRDEAIDIGTKHNQIAAWDFETMSEISIKPEARSDYIKLGKGRAAHAVDR